MKRTLINITVIALAFAFFILWHQTFIAKEVQTSSLKLIKFYEIYLVTADKGTQYWEFIDQGAADMAKAIGVKYKWMAPEERNVGKQIEIIRDAVNEGADALLIAADDPKRISGVVEDAKARGVKVLYVDSAANEEAIQTLSTNNFEAGVTAGKQMLQRLESTGVTSGALGIVSVAAKENSSLRETGFRKVIADDGRFTILDTEYTNGQSTAAQRRAEDIIDSNQNLVGLYATTARTTAGIGYAIGDNKNKYIGVGFDATDENRQLLTQGSLQVIIDQNPYTMGYLGVAGAAAAILGKDTGPEYIDTGIKIITE